MKRFVLILFGIFALLSLSAEDSRKGEDGKTHTIMFAESTLENGIYDKTDVWVTDKIKANLISVLQRYGNFNCIDLNEAKSILKVQKQLESGMDDDSLVFNQHYAV